ncbi:MAG TPA: hypothetical protein VFJ85_03895 [Acidimicrobiales bacterium]|nr:hypothetical protein [Acidimicrobiales bacterium]
MGIVDKDTVTDVFAVDGFEGRYGEVDGYTIGFESYSVDMDPAPLFQGLPDDRCQCPHWGVVLEGTMVFRYADGTVDTVEAGQAYYARPGHLPVLNAGTRVVEFSPSAGLAATMEVVGANLAAAGAGQ